MIGRLNHPKKKPVLDKEYKEYTYRPKINPKSKIKNVIMPKFYYETINRIQKAVTARRIKKESEENQYIEFDKKYKRLKNQTINPPSFLNRYKNIPERNIMFYIDINIRPGK